MLCFESKAITDTGNRREVNQDSYANNTDFANNKYVGLYCVADGMGGLSDGEYASALAVNRTMEWYKANFAMISKKNISVKKIKKSLKHLFYDINSQIRRYGTENDIRVGTTYSLLLLTGDRYFVIHAGDSRIYLKRKNRLYLLTKDQTWVNQQVERGLISLEQAKNHPKKNVLANCMGCFEEPSICTGGGAIKCDDSFLLCSDGLYNLITTEEISEGMSCKNIDYMAEELVRLVKQRGAYDNVTILMIKVVNPLSEGEITVDI